MPIIGKINDSEKEMKERMIFLRNIKGIERIDIIPVTNHGSTKYKALGRSMPQFNLNTDLDMLIHQVKMRFKG